MKNMKYTALVRITTEMLVDDQDVLTYGDGAKEKLDNRINEFLEDIRDEGGNVEIDSTLVFEDTLLN